jgi:hypothetical protein
MRGHSHGGISRHNEGCNFSTIRTLAQMVQDKRVLFIRQILLRKGRKQVGVRMLFAPKSSRPDERAGGLQRLSFCPQPCKRDFG